MILAIGAVAFATQPESTLNEWCPVMPDEKIDPAITVEYRGKTVAFCCDLCVKKFRANPVKYEIRLPQFTGVANATVGEPQGANGHDHSGSDSIGDGGDTARVGLPGSVDQRGHDQGVKGSDDEREPFLGRLHPIIIHVPIAGMPVAMLGFLVWVRSGREDFARSDHVEVYEQTDLPFGCSKREWWIR